MKKVLLVLSFLTLSLSGFAQDPKTESQSAGGDFPSVVLKDLEGKPVDLKSLTGDGQYTIISFWATWCSPCKKEIENMNDLLADWKSKYNVRFVAISIDDSRNEMKVKPYVDGKKWKFPVLIDVNQDTRRVLNYPNVPYTLLVDKNGKVVYKHIGYQEGDEFVLEDELKKLAEAK